MKHLLLIILLSPSLCLADGLFTEFAITARQQPSRLADGHMQVEHTNVSYERWREYDVNVTKNPYASIMLGYQWRFKKFDLGLAIHHESSIATGQDKGINDLRLSLRWSQE